MKRFRQALLVFFCAVLLCACSPVPVSKPQESSEQTTTVSQVKTADTPDFSEMIPESVPSETEPAKPLTDEEAMTGFTNYLYFKIKNLQKILDEDKIPCTWGIASSDKNEIMIMFRSNTGALLRYHINRKTGKTYVTQYTVETNSFYRTRETLNVREYINKKPTPTPYAIKPSTTNPTKKPTSKPKVKVSTAVDKTSIIGGKKRPYKIPKVSISGRNTNAANKKIKNELSKYNLKGANAREITYSYHVTDKLVSILVHISNTDTDSYNNYKVYNIAISSGKLVKDSKVVKLYGISNKKFYSMVKRTFKFYRGGSSVPDSDAKKIIKANLKRVSYKYVEPYIGKNGNLCFVGVVKCYGGSGTAIVLFDAERKSVY